MASVLKTEATASSETINRLGPHAIMLKNSNLNVVSYFSYNNHKYCRTSPHIPSMYFHVENVHLLAGIT